MNRYKKANEGIHAPEEVKEKAVRPAGKRSGYPRWAGAVAAVLAVAIIGGAALWGRQSALDPLAGEPGQIPAPLSDEEGPVQPRSGSGEEDGSSGRPAPAAYGLSGSPAAYEPYALSLAAYPEMHPYPRDDEFFSDVAQANGGSDDAYDAWSKAYSAWREDRQALRSDLDLDGVLDGFLASSSAQFLTNSGGENRVYSPLNIYMALSMLAETTGENSRRQILDLLDVDSMDELRTRATALWRDNYRDDGVVTSISANSLWLNDGMTYSQDTLNTLAERYYASSFSGRMGSEEYNQALRDWLNEQTGGLLAEQAAQLEMAPETVLALASTLYFKAAWDGEFSKELTQTDVFHTPSGDVDAEFMHSTQENCTFYWGDNFTAIYLPFQEGGDMWLILPAEGYSVDELLQSGEAMEFLLADKYDKYDDNGNLIREGWTGQKNLKVNLSMPKFDVSSDLDLIEGLKQLGVTDVFYPETSNFDPLGASTDEPLYLSKAQHAARVKVDEEGCEAAAYTVMMVECGAAMPPDDEVDFTLDRPFLFAVTGGWSSDLPLFVGAVNQPNE